MHCTIFLVIVFGFSVCQVDLFMPQVSSPNLNTHVYIYISVYLYIYLIHTHIYIDTFSFSHFPSESKGRDLHLGCSIENNLCPQITVCHSLCGLQ